MRALTANHQQQIEETLQRPLQADELVIAPSLRELPPAVLAVAEILAAKQLVLCTLYLRAVSPATLSEAKLFIEEIANGAILRRTD